jgi:YegS/Rv2252/BmrU family lipid kinase
LNFSSTKMAGNDQSRRIALFCNPRAGGGSALRKLPQAEAFLRARGIAYEVFGLDYPASLDGFTDVFILGGDGTINHVLNSFPDLRLPVGLLPGGTANDLAVELEESLDLRQCLETALSGRACRLDAGVCNGRIFMNCLGVGFDGEVANEISRVKLLRGYGRYLYTVVRKIFKYRSRVMHTAWDEGQYQYKALTIMAANSQYSGGGFRVAPKARINDGKLHMVVVDDLPLWKRLVYLPRFRKGRHDGLSFVRTAPFSRMHIRLDSPMSAHMDGETLTSDEFHVEVLPARFLFRVRDSMCNHHQPASLTV